MQKTLLVLLFAMASTAVQAQERKTREQKLLDDRARVETDGLWIYNDVPQAFAKAERTGKPILVVMRCVPCEECVKLDDELVDADPNIRPLLEHFVCVRQVSTNGLDLSLFQFDTDQSFAVFMLNADETIYGRFGTRSHRTDWLGDVSLPGLAKALEAVLDLHAEYPANKGALEDKRGNPLEVNRPEQFASLKDRYTDRLDYEGNVVRSCIHCHQIGDARREVYRQAGKPIPEEILFPAPHPKVIGLTLDPQEIATIKSIAPGSAAEKAGFNAGDRIRRLNGQPLVSIADVQWVLDRVDPRGDQVAADVERGSQSVLLMLSLDDGWRRDGDLSWRATSWGLRRMATGGLRLEALPQADRDRLGFPAESMALVVNHVGQYDAHAAAKRAGFLKGDIIVQWDKQGDLLRETDVLRHGVTERRAGDEIPVTVLRDGKKMERTLPMQL